MDYGNLFQQSLPSQSFFHQGIVDPLGYRLWMDRANAATQAIPGMQQEAAMNLAHQQQQEKEYQMGAPGRETLAEVANMDAESAKDQQPLKASANKWKLTNLNEDEKAKAESILKPVQEYADAWESARQDPTKRAAFFDTLKQAKITLPNGYVMGTDPRIDAGILDIARDARENSPTLSTKRDVANIQGTYSVAKATVAGQFALSKQEMADRTKMEVARINAEARQTGRLRPADQALVLMYGDGEQITPEGAAKLIQDQEAARVRIATAAGGQKITNQSDVAAGLGVNRPGPAIPATPAPTPIPGSPAAKAQQVPAPRALTEKDVSMLKRGAPFQYAPGKSSPIKDIQKNKSGQYRLILEDGTIYP